MQKRELAAIVFMLCGALAAAKLFVSSFGGGLLVVMFALPFYTCLIAGRRSWLYGPLAGLAYAICIAAFAYMAYPETASASMASGAMSAIVVVSGGLTGLLLEGLGQILAAGIADRRVGRQRMSPREPAAVAFLLLGAGYAVKAGAHNFETTWPIAAFVLPALTAMIAGRREAMYAPLSNLAYLLCRTAYVYSVEQIHDLESTAIFVLSGTVIIFIGHIVGVLIQAASILVFSESAKLRDASATITRREYVAIAFICVSSNVGSRLSYHLLGANWKRCIILIPVVTTLVAGRRGWIFGPVSNLIYFISVCFFAFFGWGLDDANWGHPLGLVLESGIVFGLGWGIIFDLLSRTGKRLRLRKVKSEVPLIPPTAED